MDITVNSFDHVGIKIFIISSVHGQLVITTGKNLLIDFRSTGILIAAVVDISAFHRNDRITAGFADEVDLMFIGTGTETSRQCDMIIDLNISIKSYRTVNDRRSISFILRYADSGHSDTFSNDTGISGEGKIITVKFNTVETAKFIRKRNRKIGICLSRSTIVFRAVQGFQITDRGKSIDTVCKRIVEGKVTIRCRNIADTGDI